MEFRISKKYKVIKGNKLHNIYKGDIVKIIDYTENPTHPYWISINGVKSKYRWSLGKQDLIEYKNENK